LYERVRDFYVCQEEGEIVGTCALHPCWEDLGEIRSLAVKESYGRRGIGTDLVRTCLQEAQSLGIKRVFALTYKADFFQRLGFQLTDKSKLPQKVWSDCIKCVKFPECDETAMILDLR
jgi:amino-acid N-acetyltransferase